MPSQINTGSRAPFIVTPIEAFTIGIDGELPITPYENELVMDTDGSIGVIKSKPDGGWEFQSVEKDNKEFLNNLDYSGVFTNAQAGSLGKDLTYFIFDLDQRTIKLNPALRFPSLYRYYAIRTGDDFITGRTNGAGEVINNLVDMDNTVQVDYGDGVVSVPEMAMILPNKNIVDGDVYVIEFYDSNRRLVGRDLYHAEAVRLMDTDRTSDVAITGIKVITTRPVDGEEDACYLYVGEDVNQLDYRVLLQYADGTYRDVTYEERVGGRLQIIGLDTFDTSIITPEGTTPNTFTVRYYILQEDGTVGMMSIDKEIKIYIKDDPNSEIIKFVPVYWVSFASLSQLQRTYLALFSSGKIVNVESKVTSDTNLPTDANGNIDVSKNTPYTINTELTVGTSGNVVLDYEYAVKFTGVDNENFSHISMDTNVFSDEYMEMEYTISGALKKGLLKDLDPVAPENTLIANNTLELDGETFTPTHFRIRNIDGTHYYTGGVGIEIAQVSSNFDVYEGAYPFRYDTPAIIEFLDVQNDASGNPVINRITNLRPIYISIINNG